MTTTEMRINQAKTSIEKITRTIERHRAQLAKMENKHEAADDACKEKQWFADDIAWKRQDIANNAKKLVAAKDRLALLQEKKSKDDAVPRIETLEMFLISWREKAREYYLKAFERYQKDLAVYREQREQAEKVIIWQDFSSRSDCQKARISFIDERLKESIGSNWEECVSGKYYGSLVRLAFSQPRAEREPFLDKMLDREVDIKRRDLIERASRIVGVITDTSGLHIDNADGSINGRVIGEGGTASIQTIWAGGYNIQCLHYRILINRI